MNALNGYARWIFNLIFAAVILFGGCGNQKSESKIPVTTNSEQAKQEFIKGRDLFEKLKFNESLAHFENAVAKDSNFALAYYYIAQASPNTYEFYKNLNKASSLTAKISSGERRMILALQANADGNAKIAEDNLERLVKEYPKDERAHNLLGSFYFNQHMFQKAVDQLKQGILLAPDYSLNYNLLGYSYKDMGNYPEAEDAFKKYIELVPNEPNPYDSYAELLMKESKYDQSIDQYGKAITLDSNFVSSYLGIASDYNYLGKYSEAREALQTLLNGSKNNNDKRTAIYGLIVSFADEGNLNMAFQEGEKLYDFDKNIKDTAAVIGDLINQGDILFEEGKLNEAEDKYNLALQTSSSSHFSYDVKRNTRTYISYCTTRILLMKNDLKSAEEKASEFSATVREINNTAQIWLSHELNGLIALQEKDYVKAENEFKEADQQNPYILFYQGLAYKGQNKMDLAKDKFKEAANFNAVNNLNQAFIRRKALSMLSGI